MGDCVMTAHSNQTFKVLAAVVVTFLASATFVFAQSQKETAPLSKEEILAGAKKEGRLIFATAHEETTVPHLVNAFKKKFPFIKEVNFHSVSGIPAGQKELFELAAGKSNVDVFTPHSVFWSEYFKQDLFAKYNLRDLAKARQLQIPAEMIDDSDVAVWTSTNSSIIVYNRDLVPADKVPAGWESCLDPYWKGKFAVDTKPNVLAWLAARWGEEKVLSYAKKLKENQPIWVRGNTGALTRAAAGEIPLVCGTYNHTTQRQLMKDPNTPLRIVAPNPLGISFHEPFAVYGKAKNPNAALLWIEFLVSNEAQQIVDRLDPGKAFFMIEGTLANKLMKGNEASICTSQCRGREEKLMERIAVEAWGLPKVGAAAK
jgi:iron(III) transport system substrate-binding protein